MTAAFVVSAVVTLVIAVLLLRQGDERERRLGAINADLMDRLFAANAAGLFIPSSDLPSEQSQTGSDAGLTLDPLVREWCSQWEGADAQGRWAAIARQYADTGLDAVATVKALESRVGA